jgi:hypothetical protein
MMKSENEKGNCYKSLSHMHVNSLAAGGDAPLVLLVLLLLLIVKLVSMMVNVRITKGRHVRFVSNVIVLLVPESYKAFTLGHVLPKMSACLQIGQKTPTGRAWGSISAGL